MKWNFIFSVASTLLAALTANAQMKGKVSMQANYGINGNFFVRSYDEQGGPDNKTYFYKKDFIGTTGGVSLSFHVSNKSSLFVEYSRTMNSGKKDYFGQIENTAIDIRDFKIRYHNNFFQLGYSYGKQISASSFTLDAGLFLQTFSDQKIAIENWDRYVSIAEATYSTSNSMEGGIFFGGGYSINIDTKVSLGIRTRGYFAISTGIFEAITITPVLRYRF